MAETIQEFVAVLGFNVDGASERRFNESLTGAVVKGNLLADAIQGAARVIGEAFGKITEHANAMYLRSRQMEGSASQLANLERAWTQAGVASNAFWSTFNAVTEKFKLSPDGYNNLARAIGVQNPERLKNDVDRTQAIIAKLTEMYQSGDQAKRTAAIAYAEHLGVSREFFAASLAEMEQFQRDAEKFNYGIGFDPDKMADAGRKVKVEWDKLVDGLAAVAQKLYTDVAPGIVKSLEFFNKKLEDLAPPAIKALGDIHAQLGLFGEALVGLTAILAAGRLFSLLGTLLGLLQGIAGVFLGVPGLLAALGLMATSGGLNQGEDEIARQRKLQEPASEEKKEGEDSTTPKGFLGRTRDRVWNWLKDLVGFGKSEWPESQDMFGGRGIGGSTGPGVGGGGGGGGGGTGVTTSSKERRIEAQHMIDRLVSKGWTPEAAASAAGQANTESGFNTRAVGDHGASIGLFQWQGGRLDAGRRWAAAHGRDWNDRDTQIDFFDEERAGRTSSPHTPSQAERDWHKAGSVHEGNVTGYKFERYAGPLQESRAAAGRGFLKDFQEKAVKSTDPSAKETTPATKPSDLPAKGAAPMSGDAPWARQLFDLVQSAKETPKTAPLSGAPIQMVSPDTMNKDRFGGDKDRSSKSQTINQTNNVEVHGEVDKDLAESIMKSQRKLNGDLLRNLQGAAM
jgi:hypothetical protein